MASYPPIKKKPRENIGNDGLAALVATPIVKTERFRIAIINVSFESVSLESLRSQDQLRRNLALDSTLPQHCVSSRTLTSFFPLTSLKYSKGRPVDIKIRLAKPDDKASETIAMFLP